MILLRKAAVAPAAPPAAGRLSVRGRGRKPQRIPRQTSVHTLAQEVEVDMARAILAALKKQQERVNISELAKLIPTASPEEIYAAASAGGTEAMAVQLQALEMDAMQRAGDLAGRLIRGPNVVIDLGRPSVADWLREHTGELITDISDKSREAVRLLLESGVQSGRHPYRMAKDIKRVVGLTPRDGAAVSRRINTLMAQGIPEEKAIAAGDKYAAKLLGKRAENIARTESLTAVNHGRTELWEQLKESGALPANVEVQWLTGDDERVCPACGPLHLMRQPLGQPWSSEDFTVDAPPLHPQCRCTTALIEPGEEENL